MKERVDALPGGLPLLQAAGAFKLTQDTIFLADFVTVRRGERALDLGAGNAALSILLAAKEETLSVDGVEISESACRAANENVHRNGLDGRVCVWNADLRALGGFLPRVAYDIVCANPPYFKAGAGKPSPEPEKNRARQEASCTMEDVLLAASRSLRFGGRFSLCFPPARLIDLLGGMRGRNLEPKRLRFVHETQAAAPSLCLVESRLGGKPGLCVMPPLIVRDAGGGHSAEYRRIYQRRDRP